MEIFYKNLSYTDKLPNYDIFLKENLQFCNLINDKEHNPILNHLRELLDEAFNVKLIFKIKG